MNIKILNQKKADGKFLSIWWFVVIVIIGLGIVIGVEIFFSGKLDIRFLESETLANRVISCLNERGSINEEFLSDNAKLLELCFLNEEIINKSGNYFLKISLKDVDTKKIRQTILFGNAAFEADCRIGVSLIKARNYPRCVYKSFSLKDNNKLVLIDLIAGSNQGYRLNDAK